MRLGIDSLEDVRIRHQRSNISKRISIYQYNKEKPINYYKVYIKENIKDNMCTDYSMFARLFIVYLKTSFKTVKSYANRYRMDHYNKMSWYNNKKY